MFGSLNLQELGQEDARLNTEGNSAVNDKYVVMPKLKAGQKAVVTVRILPPARSGRLFEYTRYHNINGRKVHDPKRLVNGRWDKSTPNPIVDHYNSLWKQADQAKAAGREAEADRLIQEARTIKPVERYYYNVIVRKVTDENGNVQANVGPKILSIGKTLHNKIVHAIMGDETSPPLGDVTDIQKGLDFNIKIEMRGTGSECYPNYDQSFFSQTPSPLGTPDEINKWAGSLHDLSENHIVTPLETLERELAIYLGFIQDDTSGYSVDKFAEKFRPSNGGGSAAPRQTAPADVHAAVGSMPVAETTAPAVEDDVPVTDDEFFAQMRQFSDE